MQELNIVELIEYKPKLISSIGKKVYKREKNL